MNTSVKTTLLTLWCCVLPLLLLWNSPSFSAQPTAFDGWAKNAKIGGAAIYVGISTTELNQILDDMVAQHVTVVEADSDLSNYQSDAQFELELVLMRQFADAAHQRGLRVVWYIPALEVITPNGKNIPNTMAKDHPDWVQVGLDGVNNVFYGGGGQVFWVEADAESAWMSPSSEGYRNYFFNRIAKMVDTGIDGVWADVPIYADFGDTKWSGFHPEAVAKFESDTGMTKPVAEDWDDPAWRRWIHWRHEELARFLKDLTTMARNIDPEFAIFAETLPTDYNGGTIYGLDSGFTKDVEGLTAVYEVDTMSNNVGMRNARTDDWISFISALKYARGATGEKPSWTFSYGKQQDDAQQVMAQALIAGNNPYELQVPEMATTVDPAFRSRMFNWSKVNSPYLFESQSTAKTGILYSSASRDYVDKFTGLGMFATTEDGGDDLWWASSTIDSVYQRDYLAEHRGVLKILVNEHIPFNILVVPDQAELSQYQTIMMPNIEAISDAEAERLKVFVQQGGRLIVTGPNPTLMDEYGTVRTNYALAVLLGFNVGDTVPTSAVQTYGNGETYYYAERLGKSYLTQNTSAARTTLANAVRGSSAINVTTNADDRIYLETSQLGQQAVLQFTNFIGLNGTFSIVPTTISVTYTTPNSETVDSVTLTSPDTTSTARTNLAFTQTGNQVTFSVPLTQYAMVVVSLNGAESPVLNHQPAAGKDVYQTDISTPLDITVNALQLNDGDLDGDTLTIGGVYASSSSVGTVNDLGAGNYRYTPPIGFTGVDSLTYTLFDSKGAQTTGTIKVTVAPASTFYNPQVVSLSVGGVDTTELTHFTELDGETYDISSVASGGIRVVDWYATTTITEDVSTIAEIKVLHLGHYSLANVSQKAYVYNYQTSSWDVFDTATVGNESNYPAAHVISGNIANYVSTSKEMRVRIRAERNSGAFDSWTDQLMWEVVPTNTGVTSNQVNTNSLTVDGNLSDWSSVTSFGREASSVTAANAQADFLEGWMAHDSETLYVAYLNDGDINTSTQWPWQVYLDTDDNNVSGYQVNGSMGAEFMLQGAGLFQYTGNGSNWSWIYLGRMEGAISGSQAEFKIPRATIGQPSSIKVLFMGRNGVFNGDYSSASTDYYPNTSLGYVGYNFGGSTPSVVLDPVSNAQTIIVDGDLAEWSALQSFGFDGDDVLLPNSEADILEGWMAHDAQNLYVAYRNDGDINTNLFWPWQVFLDTDKISTTGYQAGNNVGAEYMLQGAGLYQYIGTGADWSWQYISSGASGSVSGAIGEFKISLSAIGDPSSLHAIFVTRDGIFSGDYSNAGTDRYPDLGVGHLTYKLSSEYSNPIALNAVNIDGVLGEWAAVESFGRDGNDISVAGAQADWLEAWMAHDTNSFYLAYENDGPINTETKWPWQIYIDADDNPETGYKLTGGIGAEFIVAGSSLFQYTGTGSGYEWSWSYIEESVSSISGNFTELKLPRASLGDPADMRFVFKASNGPFTGSDDLSGIDYFPSNATASDNGYFSYSTQ